MPIRRLMIMTVASLVVGVSAARPQPISAQGGSMLRNGSNHAHKLASTICVAAMLVGCRDDQVTSPIAATPIQDTASRRVVQAVGCATIEVRLGTSEAGGISAKSIGGSSCGPFEPTLVEAPQFDAARRVARVGIALANRGIVRVHAPATLYAWNDSLKASNGVPTAAQTLQFARADSLAMPSVNLPVGVVRWSYDDALRGSLTSQAVGTALLAKGKSAPRWIEVLVPQGVKAFQMTLHAVGTHIYTVPLMASAITAPDVLAESRSPAHVHGAVGRGRVVRDRLWVKFRADASVDERQAAIDAVDGIVIGGMALGEGNYYYVQIPADADSGTVPLMRAYKLLRSLPQVRSVILHDLDSVAPTYLRPNDSTGFNQWRLRPDSADGANWGTEAISGPLAWGCETGSPTASVAILDEGFRSIADFANNLGPTQEFDPLRPPHGTAVASIVGAEGNNHQGMTGVMWRAALNLYDARRPVSGIDSSFWPFANLQRAGQAGHRIINISLGLYWQQIHGRLPGDSAADSARVDGIRDAFGQVIGGLRFGGWRPLFIVSAGNDGVSAYWSGYPAAKLDSNYADQIVVVAASRRVAGANGQLAAFSNRGALVDVAAPGDSISVLDPSNNPVADSGSSFAAPHVTGIAGLLLAFDASVTSDSLRSFVLGGAGASGRTAFDPSNNSRPNIPIANASASLKQAARQTGAPLCGNRLWPQGNTIMVQRDSARVEQLVDVGSPVVWISAMHGGKRVLYATNSGVGAASFVNGSWSTGPQLPGDTLFAGVTTATSHDGDSMVAVIGGGGTNPITLGAGPINGPLTAIPGSLPAPFSTVGPTVCLIEEDSGCDLFENAGRLSSPWSEDRDPGAIITLSFSSRGDEVYVAYPHDSLISASRAGTIECPGAPNTVRCVVYNIARRLTRGVVWAVNIRTGTQHLLKNDSTGGIWSSVADEYSSQLLYQVGTWSYQSRFSGQGGGSYDLRMPPNGTGGPCTQRYLRLTSSAPPDTALALAGSCQVASGLGTITPVTRARR